MMEPVRVSLHVVTTDPEVVTKVTDIISRTASGLALDGVKCYTYAGPEIDDDAVFEQEEVDEESDE